MAGNPRLPRRRDRRGFRRSVFLSAVVAMLLAAPGAVALPSDDSPPEITPRYFGQLGTNGWYTGDLTVNWDVRDPDGPIEDWDREGCAPFLIVADNPGTIRTCWARSAGGRKEVETKLLKVDKTAPAVSGAPSRAAGTNGWFNQALTVSFSGSDTTSGIDTCSNPAAYGGPDNSAASVVGSCRDKAGNTGVGTYSFKYDATAPSVSSVRATQGNRSAQLRWRASPDTVGIEITRSPGRKDKAQTVVFRGSGSGFRDAGLTVGRRYHYRVTAFDQAANSANQSVVVTAAGALFTPAPGAKVSTPPRLVWTRLRHAKYYNLQLIRGRKVLSAWPVRPGFQLRRTWIYNGRRYRLRPGVYRWYVWPGIGRRSAARYGRLLGSSTFVMTR